MKIEFFEDMGLLADKDRILHSQEGRNALVIALVENKLIEGGRPMLLPLK